MVIKDACTLNIIKKSNDASRIVIGDFRVMLQIVASLTENFGGIIYNCNMILVHATELIFISLGVKKHYRSLHDHLGIKGES